MAVVISQHSSQSEPFKELTATQIEIASVSQIEYELDKIASIGDKIASLRHGRLSLIPFKETMYREIDDLQEEIEKLAEQAKGLAPYHAALIKRYRELRDTESYVTA
ncbi:TPA: hypothetical protein DD449_00260 [Candidatus Berkelbacteria bacterium]|uniref:Uncharacterized protein n=1 Tax=Berkelbacteria bacterium GW2011_GWE1_39_12 TaxID=1618337 RepID=A0A0G4B1Z7_9BACT|nr:MAG: hypothetical protein UT28_C0001G0040 [Berkelbacteria bacterium GW2011_GWE1_39_12]HBO60106.1 hypothetical protein [Candidatus Berkelbacteria bacterium]